MEDLDVYRKRLVDRSTYTAAEIGRFAAAIPRDDWDRVVCEGETPRQIFTHLIDIELDYFQPLIQRLLTRTGFAAGGCKAQKWLPLSHSGNERLEAVLEDFEHLRRREAEALSELPIEAWSRPCQHPVWGERTLQWWVEQSVAHSMQHLRQLRACFPGLVV